MNNTNKKEAIKKHPHFFEEVELNKDHIIPKSFLRELKQNNIQLMPKSQNSAKGDKLTKEALAKVFKAIINHL